MSVSSLEIRKKINIGYESIEKSMPKIKNLDSDQIALIVNNYVSIMRDYVLWTVIVLNKVDNEKVRNILLEDVEEEVGEKDTKPHVVLANYFLDTVKEKTNFSDQNLLNRYKTKIDLLRKDIKETIEKSAVLGMAFIATLEGSSHLDMKLLTDISKKLNMSREEALYPLIHSELDGQDGGHGDIMLNALDELLSTEVIYYENDVKDGIKLALNVLKASCNPDCL